MPRPSVDVVVPFAGGPQERHAVVERMRRLDLAAHDTLTIVDNSPVLQGEPEPEVLHAPARQTSYHARNRGAGGGRADWILFLDADVVPPGDLLERCFGAPLDARVGIVAGGVHDDRPADPRALPLAARYAALRAPMSQERTLGHAGWSYAQTANAAFRRGAFDAAGGFDERPRSGGDADLCFRLREAGWDLVYRPAATVIHRNRATVRGLLRQRLRHGAGSRWLERRYPGSQPARPVVGHVRRQAGTALREAAALHGEAALMAALDVAAGTAFLLGRLLPNEPR